MISMYFHKKNRLVFVDSMAIKDKESIGIDFGADATAMLKQKINTPLIKEWQWNPTAKKKSSSKLSRIDSESNKGQQTM